MSYDEHLISQAGGDGDMVDQIQRRINDCQTYKFGMRNADKLAHEDAPYLLALVREQAAKLDAVEAVTEHRDHSDHCDLYHFYKEGGCTCWQRDILYALEQKP